MIEWFMQKIIIAGIILMLIGAVVFWQTNSKYNQNDSISPTVSVTEIQIPEGWQKFENEELGISFYVPVDYTIEKNGDYSILATPPVDRNYPVGSARFFYVSVVPISLKEDETAQVYNYSSSFHKKLIDIPVGEKVNLSVNEGQKDWYIYERLSDENINGKTVKVIVNQRPWEFPNGTWEYRYIFELPQKTVIAGAYIDGETSDTEFTLPLLKKIINTMSIE